MTEQKTLFEAKFKPRPIRLGSADARRLKVGKLKATLRSLNYLRKQGWEVDVLEKFVTHGGTQAQQSYIDELLKQRRRLVCYLREFTNVRSRAMLPPPEQFLEAMSEPKPPEGIGGYRKDPFGFMDIEAYRGDETLAVQTTSFQQIATHLRAFRRDEKLRKRILDWIAGRDRTLVIHGWRCMEVAMKSGKGTKAEWQLTERVVEPSDLSEERF